MVRRQGTIIQHHFGNHSTGTFVLLDGKKVNKRQAHRGAVLCVRWSASFPTLVGYSRLLYSFRLGNVGRATAHRRRRAARTASCSCGAAQKPRKWRRRVSEEGRQHRHHPPSQQMHWPSSGVAY